MGPTWFLVSLASSLYLGLGSVSSWLGKCLLEAGGRQQLGQGYPMELLNGSVCVTYQLGVTV